MGILLYFGKKEYICTSNNINMKRILYILLVIVPLMFFSSCASMKAPAITYFENQSIKDYTYFYVTPTNEILSSSREYGTQDGVYLGTIKSINPADVISGMLFKNGFIRVDKVLPENADKTMVINYGESGRRNVNLGYSIEVTIQFINAATQKPIVFCTGEGQGETEVDDIRKAINRALEPLFK